MSFSPIDIKFGRTKNRDGIVPYEEIEFDLITIGAAVGVAVVAYLLLASLIGSVAVPLVPAYV